LHSDGKFGYQPRHVFGALMGGAISQLFGFKASMYAAAALTAIGFCFFRVASEEHPYPTRRFLCAKKIRTMIKLR
jgi:predicted MFS family arabinose efflux permease